MKIFNFFFLDQRVKCIFLDKKGKIFENFHLVVLSVENKGKIFLDRSTNR